MGGQRLSKQKSWAIVDAYAADHPDVFAGSYVGGEGEPPIVTLWTRDATRHAAVLSNRTGRTIGGRSARWSEAYLDSVRGRISNDMDRLIAEGIAVCRVGDNVMKNCVDVGVTGLTAAARDTITSRYGEAVNVREDTIVLLL